MRVLVTGGAGFIGSHVVELLLANDHVVAVVNDLSTGKRENVPMGVKLYVRDIRSGCDEVFEEFRPEALSHQAARWMSGDRCGNRTSTINGSGEQTRDYVYVADVVARAKVLALENEIPNGAYNIGTSIETSVNANSTKGNNVVDSPRLMGHKKRADLFFRARPSFRIRRRSLKVY